MRCFKIIISIILTSVICIGTVTGLVSQNDTDITDKEEKLELSAKSAVLMDFDSKTILYGLNENEVLPMASITKIMTAIIVIENNDLSKLITIKGEMTGAEGSSIYLKPGEKFTVEELLYGLMLNSGNDAAVALAIHTSGSIGEFVKLMNKKADDLGLVDTSFVTPNGLDAEGHHTTAYEFAKIAAYCLKNEEFAKIAATKRKTIGTYGGTKARYLKNSNKMLSIYEGANGVKTGYTKRSGRTLVSSATRNDMTLIAVTLNDRDDWKDHSKLLDYGFENFKLVKVFPDNKEFSVNVTGGDKKHVLVKGGDMKIAVNTENIDKIIYKVNLPRFLYAPVNRGDVVGEVEVFLNGESKTKYPLTAAYDIKIKKKNNFLKSLWSYLFN